jgi:hypothetical protein
MYSLFTPSYFVPNQQGAVHTGESSSSCPVRGALTVNPVWSNNRFIEADIAFSSPQKFSTPRNLAVLGRYVSFLLKIPQFPLVSVYSAPVLDMGFVCRSEYFTQRTETIVNRLVESSHRTAEQLTSVSSKSEAILERADKSLALQSVLEERQEGFRVLLEGSMGDISAATGRIREGVDDVITRQEAAGRRQEEIAREHAQVMEFFRFLFFFLLNNVAHNVRQIDMGRENYSQGKTQEGAARHHRPPLGDSWATAGEDCAGGCADDEPLSFFLLFYLLFSFLSVPFTCPLA